MFEIIPLSLSLSFVPFYLGKFTFPHRGCLTVRLWEKTIGLKHGELAMRDHLFLPLGASLSAAVVRFVTFRRIRRAAICSTNFNVRRDAFALVTRGAGARAKENLFGPTVLAVLFVARYGDNIREIRRNIKRCPDI